MKYLKVLIVNYDKDNKVNKEKIINKVNKSYKSSSVAKTRNKIYIYIYNYFSYNNSINSNSQTNI